MSARCQARQVIPAAFGGSNGQVICDLGMAHQCAAHYDRALSLWWLPALAGEHWPEDVPMLVRPNENIPAAVQAEWGKS